MEKGKRNILASGLDQVGQFTPACSGQPTLGVCLVAVSESPPLSVPAADGSSQCVTAGGPLMPTPAVSILVGHTEVILGNSVWFCIMSIIMQLGWGGIS